MQLTYFHKYNKGWYFEIKVIYLSIDKKIKRNMTDLMMMIIYPACAALGTLALLVIAINTTKEEK